MSVTITITMDGSGHTVDAGLVDDAPAPVEGIAARDMSASVTGPPPDPSEADVGLGTGSLGGDSGEPPVPLDSEGEPSSG